MIGKTISHYKILEKLGEGGMGVVYKAEDTKLKRTVALKFLPPEFTRDEEAKQRFIHEAQAASALEHTNICTIHEIDETDDGQTFIVMACYGGEILKDRIQKGPLSIEEAIDIAIQVVQGLDKAHHKEIVHRDIKPGNILITEDGVVKIIDFGLAKLTGRSKLTKESSTLGTAAYMSPEQAEGREADHRSDIWSLGVVLYEMLTGQLPFKGEYDQAVLYSILNESPEPITGLRTGIPMELERIVNECLEKDPSLRYQHADGLLADLRRLKRDTDRVTTSQVSGIAPSIPSSGKGIFLGRKRLIGLVAGVGLVAAILAVLLFMPRDDTVDSLAILPFVNASDQRDTDWLSDGIPESIIASLQRIPNLRVTSFQSLLRQYEDKVPAVDDVRRDFNVKSVVMGRMALRGDNITVNIEIVDTRDNSVILTHEYIEKLSNLFNVRTQIGRDITDKLSLKLTGEVEEKVFPIQRPDHEAYQQYLRGRHFQYKRTPRDLKIALDYFQRAIEIDPEYALAYSGLADTYRLMRQYAGASRYSIQPKIRAAAEKALELDETLTEAHTSMGGALMNEQKYLEARKAFDRAIELNPNYLLAYHWGSLNLESLGMYEDAIALGEKALELDPRSPIISANLAEAYGFLGRHDKAMEESEKNIRLNPDHPSPYFSYATGMSLTGEHDKAIEHYRRALELDPVDVDAYQYLGYLYRITGEYEKSLAPFRKIIELEPERPSNYRRLGRALGIVGDHDGAIEQFKKAVEINPAEYDCLGVAYFCARDFDRAVENLKKALEVVPDNAYAFYWLFHVYLFNDQFVEGIEYATRYFDMVDFPNRDAIYKKTFSGGIIDEETTKNYIRYVLDEINKKENPGWVPGQRATLYSFVDEKDSAFVMLEKTFERQDVNLPRFIQTAFSDNLRSDPRFDALIKKLKLEKYIKPME